MAERIDQHRQAKHVGEQDELLAHQAIAGLPGLGEETYPGEPFLLAQLHLASEGVQVLDQLLQQAAQPRVRRGGETGEDQGGDPLFGGARTRGLARLRRHAGGNPSRARSSSAWMATGSNGRGL